MPPIGLDQGRPRQEGDQHGEGYTDRDGDGATSPVATLATRSIPGPPERLAEAQIDQGAPTFAYRLDYQSPALEGALGACHALDIPFVFGTHGEMSAFAGSGPGPDRLAEQVMDAWLAFARTGNPSTKTLRWPAYETEQRQTMVLNVESRVESRPRETERQCWEGRR